MPRATRKGGSAMILMALLALVSMMACFLTLHLSSIRRQAMTDENPYYQRPRYRRPWRNRLYRRYRRNMRKPPQYDETRPHTIRWNNLARDDVNSQKANAGDRQIRGANQVSSQQMSRVKEEPTTHHNQPAKQLAKAFPMLIKYFKSELEMEFLRELPTKFIEQYKSPCWKDPSLGLRCLPYAYLMGQPKCGTSDLYKRINFHPQFTGAKRKEVRYLTQIKGHQNRWLKNGHQSINVFTDFHSRLQEQISNGLMDQVLIDGGPHTLWWPASFENKVTVGEVPLEKLIRRLTPDVKLIMTTRNPADRAYSDYNFLPQNQPRSPEGFHESIEEQIRVLSECMAPFGGAKNITLDHALRCAEKLTPCCKASDREMGRLGISFYGPYIHKWYKVFPREQILVLRMEDFDLHNKKTREDYMRKVFRHLDVEDVTDWSTIFPSEEIANIQHKKSKPMMEKTRKLINEFMRPINGLLVNITNDTRFYWDEYEFGKVHS